MLITNLLPMLGSYSLAFDLVAGDDGVVTLIIIPRVAEGKTHKAEAGELRPISITATAAEIDAELAKGAEGALGGLIATRMALADQIATQRDAAEAARAASAEAAKAKAASAPGGARQPLVIGSNRHPLQFQQGHSDADRPSCPRLPL